MVTLAADVSASERCLRVEGNLDGIEPHHRFRIGDELIDLYGFDRFPRKAGVRETGLDRTRWMVVRGVGGSQAQSHAAGTVIRSAISASVSSSGIEPPAPFPGVISSGEPGSHDHTEYAATTHGHTGYATQAAIDAAVVDHEATEPHIAADHSHDTSHGHTAVEIGAAEADHSHDTTHSHDLSAYATSADLTAHQNQPHGGEGGGGTHPDLAAHETLGLAADDHTHDTTHSHSEYATDSDLTTHAETAHGLSSHALDGAYHSGTEVLPSTGQKNALAGTSGTPGDSNRFVTNSDARLSDARTPTTHTHDYADSGHTHDTSHTHDLSALATDSEVTAAIAAHVSSETHGSGGASHTHTAQPDPGTLTLSGNTNQQIGQLRDAINADRAILKAAGIIS